MEHFLQTIGVSPWMGWHVVQKRLWEWLITGAPPWMLSAAGHMVLFLIVALIPIHVASKDSRSIEFEAVERDDSPRDQITRFEVGDPPLEPTELNTETLMQFEPEPIAQTAQYNDDSPIFEESGGGVAAGTEAGAGLGFDIKASGLGPVLHGGGGVDMGLGTGQNAGRGGAGSGFGLRGSGSREAVPGVTKASERAVAAALNWLARHQNKDGSWTLDLGRGDQCTDRSCTTGNTTRADTGATGMGILPFLGAGQTHQSNGPYQKTVQRGLQWLVKRQKQDGDLSSNEAHQMYEHGIATIALCEAYGMTQDSWVRDPAQAAIRFIESAQNAQGGWRYRHGSYEGDTSVFGWQIMALKSAKMAGLDVNPVKFKRCENWLQVVASGHYKGRFAYMPGNGPRESMTAVGLLGLQYTGTKRTNPAVQEAVEFLMQDMPSLEKPDMYYWYYATLALHNVPGEDWDSWNRQMRKLLIDTQVKNRCAEGSWNPADDAWCSTAGGRLMMTSLAALTLEVYYRYLPMYQLDDGGKAAPADKPPAEEKDK